MMERQEIEEIQSALDGEREHSAFLEKLLKVLYGDGWNKLTLFDAKKIYEHNKALEARLKEAEEENLLSRCWMWMNHSHTGMYGDDGEMQCAECFIKYGFFDWKRTPLKEIHERIVRAALKDLLGQKPCYICKGINGQHELFCSRGRQENKS